MKCTVLKSLLRIIFNQYLRKGDITISKKRRFKQRQKEQEFGISFPKQQAIQNDRTLYIDED